MTYISAKICKTISLKIVNRRNQVIYDIVKKEKKLTNMDNLNVVFNI